MPNKPPKDEFHQQSSSIDRTTPATEQEGVPGAAMAEEISVEQLEEIFIRARQTVKPIITREAKNEIVDEEVLAFKMVCP